MRPTDLDKVEDRARTPLLVDAHDGRLRSGEHEIAILENGDALESYLTMIYRARGIRRGEHIPLRNEDLDVLAGLVGNDPEEVESRLIELMDCTPEEARSLRALLFRRRTIAAAAGLAFGLTAMIGAIDHAHSPSSPSESQAPVVLSPFQAVPDDGPSYGEESSAVLERDGEPQHAPGADPSVDGRGDALAPVVAVNDAPYAELIPPLTLEVPVPGVGDVPVVDTPSSVVETPTSVVVQVPGPAAPIADTMVGPDASDPSTVPEPDLGQ